MNLNHWIVRLYPFKSIGRRIYLHGSRKAKKIALSFDDGPSEKTEGIIKILKKYYVKGTFFVVGNKVIRNEKTMKKITMGGHEIGNHTYNHTRLLFKSKGLIKKEIEKTDKVLSKRDIKTKLFRPPYSKFGLGLLAVSKKLNKKIILMDVAPRDFEDLFTEEVVKFILRYTKPGSIIDLHDSGWVGRKSDIPLILKKIIPTLQKKGYEFVTVSELLEL